VVTELDFISQIDVQVGMVQQLLCDDNHKSHQNACHSLEGTICHLVKHCGDPHGRFSTCRATFDLGAIYPSLASFVFHNRFMVVPAALLFVMVLLALLPEIM